MFASFYAGGLLSGGDMKWGYVAAYLTTFFCPGLFGTKSVYNIGSSAVLGVSSPSLQPRLRHSVDLRRR
jgi:hypothetical protein